MNTYQRRVNAKRARKAELDRHMAETVFIDAIKKSATNASIESIERLRNYNKWLRRY